jgi:anti-anti-sigma factor
MSSASTVRASGSYGSTPLLAEVRAHPDHVRVVIRGDLDRGNRRQLCEVIGGLARAGHRHVVVDLTELAFCDLGGFRALVDADEMLRRAGAVLVVAGAPPLLRWVVARTRPECVLQLDGENPGDAEEADEGDEEQPA